MRVNFGIGFYDGNSYQLVYALTGSPSDKFITVKLSSGVALTSSGQILYRDHVGRHFLLRLLHEPSSEGRPLPTDIKLR